MADPIPPITDDYIDSVIISNGPFDPNLNKTQGIPTRALLKTLRDRMEQQTTDAFDQISAETSAREAADVTLQTEVDGKVDQVTGYGLSQENYTADEKAKLASLSEHFKGVYTSLDALSLANPTGNPGDYAYVDPGTGEDAQMYIWDDANVIWVPSSGTGTVPYATETSAGIVALATIAQALAGTDDSNAMTALKTLSVILDQKKNVNYQIAPVSLNEVSILMLNSGNVNSLSIAGASDAKLKIGITGTYPSGTQIYPFAYTAGDRVFITYNYDDLSNASCNIILTCLDN